MMISQKHLQDPEKSPISERYLDAEGVNHPDKVWQKIDIHILPLLAMFYLLSFIDQTSLGNCRVVGMQKDVAMSDYQFCWAITITFIPYTLIQLPFTILLKKFGPNVLLPAMAMAWGVVTMSQAIVTSYKGLLVCRAFLGLFTGGVSPGLVMYLSYFFPRQRMSLKIAAFFCTASIASAFSGLLAYAIVNLDGRFRFQGWAWIFLIEGGFTVAFGLVSFFLLPADLENCRFLTSQERIYVLAELQSSGTSGEEEVFSWREMWYAFKSPHVLMVAAIFYFTGSVIDGLSYFTPTIVNQLGYEATRSQLYSIPPFALSAFVCLGCAYVGDYYNFRAPIAIFCCLLCTVGFMQYLEACSYQTKYFSLFFSIPGAYCIMPSISAWGANNSAPLIRRATTTALNFIMSNTGGITSAWLYGIVSAPPLYTAANTTMLMFSVMGLLLTCTNVWYLHGQNREKEKRRLELGDKKEEDIQLGDRSAYYEYCL